MLFRSDTEDEEQDEEMALITQRFKKFLRKKKQGMRKRPFTKGEQSKEKVKDQPLICYECKKPGHFKSECPQLKKGPKKFKKKAMMATWSASDDSSSDEETSTEQANLCLMAHENEVCLASQGGNRKWYLDSGCSRHMTGDESQFITLDALCRVHRSANV